MKEKKPKKKGYVLAWCARNSGDSLFGACEVGFVKEREEEEETELGGIGVVFDLVDGVVPHSFIGFCKRPPIFCCFTGKQWRRWYLGVVSCSTLNSIIITLIWLARARAKF